MSETTILQPSPEDLRRGMRSVGLGSRYVDRRFEDLGEIGKPFETWYRSADFKSEVRTGQGRCLYGGIRAHDVFMVLARACYLASIKTRVISLSVLVNEVVGTEISVDVEGAQALFLTPFYRPDIKQPLSDFQRLAIEDFLIERLDNAQAVFTVSTGSLDESRAWWSQNMIDRLKTSNLEVHIP